jgi:hypothetical protein
MPLNPQQSLGREELLSAIRQADPRVKLCAVQKERRARLQPVADGNLIIEIAEIDTPQLITTVGVEDDLHLHQTSTEEQLQAARRAVCDAVKQFGLDESMKRMNYVEAVERWATMSRV